MNSSVSVRSRIISCIILAAMAFLFASSALASAGVITVVSVNSPPVVENLVIETFRGVPVMENFRCIDPEGDTVSYAVSKAPKKGTVDIENDIFTYTPAEGKKGSDVFYYVAVDSVGNVSQEGTVNISIKKQTTKVTYSDMNGDRAQYAATLLAEKGVFIGEQIGSAYFFSPDETVSRGEFLVMCMELCGVEAMGSVARTGFFDDGDIPAWQKPYVSAALLGNYISGHKDEMGRTVFSPESDITAAEASVMLNNIMGVTDVYSVSFADSECPDWAAQAVMNLNSCGISSELDYSEPLTRRAAANMLVDAIKIIESEK